jgi:hypothetical protein
LSYLGIARSGVEASEKSDGAEEGSAVVPCAPRRPQMLQLRGE